MPSTKTIAVAMSGGVDSSVSALLLKQQGYRLIGMYMKNWDDTNDPTCPAIDDFEDVVRVCTHIGIPYYSVNFVSEYRQHVFHAFLEDFKKGLTPNPDILCNREIKFKFLLEKALELGADMLATGHYCQTAIQEGNCQLIKGKDPGKDQSYFLYAVKEQALQKVLFPVGAMLKSEVRAIAQENNLATASKKDSTGICFIGERNFKQFLSQYIQISPGNFEDLFGNVVGTHDGAAFYTIGQRKGLKIGGKGEAWFVVDKDTERNVVILAQGDSHPALFSDYLIASDIIWISPQAVPKLPFKCKAKIRYRQEDQECIIESIFDGKAKISFSSPQRAVTPSQSIVFYEWNRCLGGAIIQKGFKLPQSQ
jgi:tRNA-uridine 2-sulfurtransferase